MADVEFEKGVTIKTAAPVQKALNRVVAEVKGSPRVRWKGGDATKEAVVNAVWLWLGDQEPEFIEEAMAAYMPRLEALLRGEKPPPAPGRQDVTPRAETSDGLTPGPRRRRGAG